ncbi:MAG: hypothetical protein VKJ09_00540 [Leptolyngbya sp.]|nr:hypothetical protein [Leptolyngbya sp.]
MVALNGAIALAGFYLAWQLWQVRNTLAEVADTVLEWERNTHGVLDPAVTPPAILQGQTGTATVRAQYARLQGQLRQAQRILGLIGLGGQLWRRRSPWGSRKSPRRRRRLPPSR